MSLGVSASNVYTAAASRIDIFARPVTMAEIPQCVVEMLTILRKYRLRRACISLAVDLI